MSKLLIPSPKEWVEVVLSDFDAFLLDHATCERKASATALSLISHYPDRPELVRDMMQLAREELEHFHQMIWLLQAGGLVLGKDVKDLYIQGLRKELRSGSEEYFLDRLLISGIVEARGCERFGLVTDALEPGPMKDFYQAITRSEAQHHMLFYRLAQNYFEPAAVDERQSELFECEAEVLRALPIRPVVH